MKTKIWALAAIAAFFASCSGDDGPATNGTLTKKWYWVGYVTGGMTIPYDDNEACGKDYIQFIADGTLTSVDVFDCVEETDGIGTWTRNGNSLVIDVPGDSTENLTITELTDTTLKLKGLLDFDDDGTTETVVMVYSATP